MSKVSDLAMLEERIKSECKLLQEAKKDYANSVLSDNHQTQVEVTVFVGNRRYSLTRMNGSYRQVPRPGYEMMLLAAKKILAAYIDELEGNIRKLEQELIKAAESIAASVGEK